MGNHLNLNNEMVIQQKNGVCNFYIDLPIMIILIGLHQHILNVFLLDCLKLMLMTHFHLNWPTRGKVEDRVQHTRIQEGWIRGCGHLPHLPSTKNGLLK